MRFITKTELTIRLVFFICVVSAGLIASIMEDKQAKPQVVAQPDQEVVILHHTPVANK